MDKPPAKRILVVDDDLQVRRYLCRLLADAGFEVAAAESGPDALKHIQGARPDLVSLDLVMPEMDGWRVLERLAATVDPPPVLVLTGRIEEGEDHPLPSPAVGIVNKADDPRVFVETCRRILEGRLSEPLDAPGVERRQARRRPMVIPARVTTVEGLPLLEGHVVRLSPIGAGLEVKEPLMEPAVRLWMSLPGREEPVGIEGVLHTRGTVGETFVYGVSFRNISSETQRRLERLLVG
jgi:CheY-like chemotaxis protein